MSATISICTAYPPFSSSSSPPEVIHHHCPLIDSSSFSKPSKRLHTRKANGRPRPAVRVGYGYLETCIKAKVHQSSLTLVRKCSSSC